MAALDFNQFSHLHKFFPELTELQSGYAYLLAFGSYSVASIAEIRGVSTETVKESVFSIKQKLHVSDMKSLRVVILSRVLMSLSVLLCENPSQVKYER
jgi:hypothetical protein